MIALPCLLLLAALCLPALADPTSAPCKGEFADWIEDVRTAGRKAAYDCLTQDEAAGSALIEIIEGEGFEGSEGQERVTRALAIWLIHRLDRPLTGEEVRALSAADRRIVRDAVHARRGRQSPAPEHDKVFRQFDWYNPQPDFTNARLTDLDRQNIAMLDKPPPPPEPEGPPSAAEAVAETAGVGPAESSRCGCASGGAAGGAILVLPLLLARRRRALPAR